MTRLHILHVMSLEVGLLYFQNLRFCEIKKMIGKKKLHFEF